jgi:septal ring factor EnvC (AmiA/AmiB activator)
MNVLRRCGAALLLVCSLLGFALCLGGVIGVWIVHQPAKEFVGDTLDTLDSYLTLASQTVQQVNDRTTRLRTTLDNAREELNARGVAERGAITARLTPALQEASGTLVSLGNVMQALSNSMATANRALGHMARLPGFVPPTLPDDLQTLEQRLSTIADRVDTLGATVSDASVQLASLTDRLRAVQTELQDLDQQLDQWTARLATAQTTIASAKATAPTVIDLASVGLSLLFVLFGVGQVSLGILAWRWLQPGSVGAASGLVSPTGAGAG